MSNSAIRNMAVMLWAMSFIKSLDQEDPRTIMYTRIGFGVYILIGLILNLVLHRLIIQYCDKTVIKIPPKPVNPFLPSPSTQVDGSGHATEQKDEYKTIMEYDLSILSQSRFSWISNAMLLSFIHFKMGAITPIIMSVIMGLNRYFDDPLFNLYILGKPAVGKLKRPFVPEKSPLVGMLQQLTGAGSGNSGEANEDGGNEQRNENSGRVKEEEEEELAGSSEEDGDSQTDEECKEDEDDLDGEIDATGSGESKKEK